MNNDKPNDPIEFLSREVQKRVAERYAVPIHSILLLAPGSLLKTPSGKVQRQACRKAFLMGTFFSLQSKKKVK
jgi:acyl-CoA synthetase (AMP-forming)/AMP-acid ligase II